MGEWADYWGESRPAVIPEILRGLGGVVWEARLRRRHGTGESDVRVVVAFPDECTVDLMADAVRDHGGTVEGLPASLALGKPLPDGHLLAFSVPSPAGQALLGLPR